MDWKAMEVRHNKVKEISMTVNAVPPVHRLFWGQKLHIIDTSFPIGITFRSNNFS